MRSSLVLRWLPAFLQPSLARLQASNVGYRLARGTFWSALGTAISHGLGFAASIVVARMLGKEGFGELGIIQSTVGMFAVFAGLGLGMTVTKHVAEFRSENPAKAGRIMSLCALVAVGAGGSMAVVLAVLAPWLATHTLAAPHLSGLLQIGSGLLFFGTLNGMQTGALAGFEAFRSITRVNLWAGLVKFPMMVGGVYVAGLTGAACGLVASMGVHWLLNHLALRREVSRASVAFPAFRGCTREWKVLPSFSLPALFSGAMVAPVQWAAMTMLVNQSDGYSQLGIYNAAVVFQLVMLGVGTTINRPLLSIYINERPSSQSRLRKFNILITWLFGVLLISPILAFPELGQLFYGEEYEGDTFRSCLVLVMISTAIMLYKQGLARVLIANSLLWWGFLSNIVWGIILLFSAFLLVRWGAVGLAASYAIAYALNTMIILPLYLKKDLIPRATLISAEALGVWAGLLVIAGAAMINMPIAARGAVFVCVAGLVVWAVWRLTVGTERAQKENSCSHAATKSTLLSEGEQQSQ